MNMLDVLLSGNMLNIVLSLFSLLIVLLIAFPIHECAHALVAKWLGDPTGEEQGRITLNPFSHLDPIGTIGLLLFGIGWAKPVPVNPYRARKVSQKTAMALTAAAGPASNILIALLFMILCKVVLRTAPDSMTFFYIAVVLEQITQINLYLGVFNLLPIPPFDGSRLFLSFLPNKYYFGIMKYERYIMIALLLLLWTGILQIPLNFLANLIYDGLDFITGFLG